MILRTGMSDDSSASSLLERERRGSRLIFESMNGSLTSCLRCHIVLNKLRLVGIDVLVRARPYASLRESLYQSGSPFVAATPKLDIETGYPTHKLKLYHESTCFRFLVEQWHQSEALNSHATQFEIWDWCAHVEFLLQEFRVSQQVNNAQSLGHANGGDRQWLLRTMGTHLAAICAQLDTKRHATLSHRVAHFIVGDSLSAADISLFVLLLTLARHESLLFTLFPFLEQYFWRLARSEPFSSCQEVLQAIPKL